MAITVTTQLQLKDEEAITNFLAWLNGDEGLALTRTRKGFIEGAAFRGIDNPNEFFSVAQWESKADHEAYMQWRTERGDMEAFSAMLAAPPVANYYDPVGVE